MGVQSTLSESYTPAGMTAQAHGIEAAAASTKSSLFQPQE
jgi:hypothetical protein